MVSDAASAGIEAAPGQEAVLRAALLKPHAHMQCWDKAGIPEHLHYGHHARIPAFLCLAEAGWLIVPDAVERVRPGNHGYDPMVPDMQAIFIASGPAMRQGVLLPAFDNVNVYPLLMKLLTLPANPSDGTLEPTAAALR
jgi:predicted AlkP superfamily pyrophosphatase or phosphodiesterase